MTEPKEGEKVYYTENYGWKGRFFFRDKCLFMKVTTPYDFDKRSGSFDDYVFFMKSEHDQGRWCCFIDDPGYGSAKCDVCNSSDGDIPPIEGWCEGDPGFFIQPLRDFHQTYLSFDVEMGKKLKKNRI